MGFLQKAREQWAETLWANLNANLLQEGIEAFLKQLRKLPKDIRQMPVGKVLDNKMKEFKDSLPLFVDLKHEALRDRSDGTENTCTPDNTFSFIAVETSTS